VVALCCLVAGLAGCGGADKTPALDRAAAEANIRANDTGDEQYNAMTRVLALEPETVTALQAAFARRDEVVENWLAGEKGQRLIELEAQLFAAVEARSLAEVKRTTAAAKPLRNELRQLIQDHESAILGTLPPDKQVEWQGYEVSDQLLTLMKPLELGFEQAQAIEHAGAPAVGQCIQRGEPNPKAAAFLEVEAWVEERVLTPEQREGYQEIKSKNKMRSLGV